MKKIAHLSLMICLLFAGSVTIAYGKARVAVMDFDNKTPYGGWRVGSGASDMLATTLVKLGKFSVIERDKLSSLMKEQELGLSGVIDISTAAQIGEVLGVEYIITGAVTEYGQSSGGGGGRDFQLGKKGYHAAVDIRIINVATGEIIFADNASDRKTSMNIRVFGIGGGEKTNEKKATEAMRGAIDKLGQKIDAANLSTQSSHIVKANVPKGAAMVADVDGKTVMLNKGGAIGFKVGQLVTISRQQKVIKDPETGNILKIKYKTIGEIRLTEVEDSYSEGEIVSGSGIKVSDIVK